MCWLAMKIKQNILFIFFSQLLCVVIASPMKLRARIFTRFNGKSVCVYSFKLCLCFLWANWCERHSMYDYGDWTYWTNSATYWIVCAIGHRLCGANWVEKQTIMGDKNGGSQSSNLIYERHACVMPRALDSPFPPKCKQMNIKESPNSFGKFTRYNLFEWRLEPISLFQWSLEAV